MVESTECSDVDEDSYQYAGIDFVVDPSAPNAFPGTVIEGLKAKLMAEVNLLTEGSQDQDERDTRKFLKALVEKVGIKFVDAVSQEKKHESCYSCLVCETKDGKAEKKVCKCGGKHGEAKPTAFPVDIEKLEKELALTRGRADRVEERLIALEKDYRNLYLENKKLTKIQGTTRTAEVSQIQEEAKAYKARYEEALKSLESFKPMQSEYRMALEEVEALKRVEASLKEKVAEGVKAAQVADKALEASENSRRELEEKVKAVPILKTENTTLRERVTTLERSNLHNHARYECMRRGVDEGKLKRLLREDFTRDDVDKALSVLSEMTEERPQSITPSRVMIPDVTVDSASKRRVKSIIGRL